jgi:hypothetical protein
MHKNLESIIQPTIRFREGLSVFFTGMGGPMGGPGFAPMMGPAPIQQNFMGYELPSIQESYDYGMQHAIDTPFMGGGSATMQSPLNIDYGGISNLANEWQNEFIGGTTKITEPAFDHSISSLNPIIELWDTNFGGGTANLMEAFSPIVNLDFVHPVVESYHNEFIGNMAEIQSPMIDYDGISNITNIWQNKFIGGTTKVTEPEHFDHSINLLNPIIQSWDTNLNGGSTNLIEVSTPLINLDLVTPVVQTYHNEFMGGTNSILENLPFQIGISESLIKNTNLDLISNYLDNSLENNGIKTSGISDLISKPLLYSPKENFTTYNIVEQESSYFKYNNPLEDLVSVSTIYEPSTYRLSESEEELNFGTPMLEKVNFFDNHFSTEFETNPNPINIYDHNLYGDNLLETTPKVNFGLLEDDNNLLKPFESKVLHSFGDDLIFKESDVIFEENKKFQSGLDLIQPLIKSWDYEYKVDKFSSGLLEPLGNLNPDLDYNEKTGLLNLNPIVDTWKDNLGLVNFTAGISSPTLENKLFSGGDFPFLSESEKNDFDLFDNFADKPKKASISHEAAYTIDPNRFIETEKYGLIDTKNIDDLNISLVNELPPDYFIRPPETDYGLFAKLTVNDPTSVFPNFDQFSKLSGYKDLLRDELVPKYLDYRDGLLSNKVKLDFEHDLPEVVESFGLQKPTTPLAALQSLDIYGNESFMDNVGKAFKVFDPIVDPNSTQYNVIGSGVESTFDRVSVKGNPFLLKKFDLSIQDPDYIPNLPQDNVKYKTSCANELIANKLGKVLGVNVAEDISYWLGPEAHDGVLMTELQGSDANFNNRIRDKEKLKDLRDIFLFDVIIGNTDRGWGNFIESNNDVYAIDHSFHILNESMLHQPLMFNDYNIQAVNPYIRMFGLNQDLTKGKSIQEIAGMLGLENSKLDYVLKVPEEIVYKIVRDSYESIPHFREALDADIGSPSFDFRVKNVSNAIVRRMRNLDLLEYGSRGSINRRGK